MKLLFAIKQLRSAIGGAERVFCTISSELVARGHEVICVTFDRPDSPSFYPLDERIERIDLGIGDTTQRATAFETLARIQRLRRCLNDTQPQVAVGFMHSMYVPLAIAAWGTSLPIMGSEHIVPEYYKNRRLEYFLLMATAPLLNKITVLSEKIRHSYPGVLRKRMIAIPNPVGRLRCDSNDGDGQSEKAILNVGRLDDQKDQETLIRAFALVADEFPGWQLRIIGEGRLRAKLEQLILDLNLGNRVFMPGTTTRIDLEYAAADIFVISSLYESFGLVTAEAMSFGLPTIGFADCPGTNELICDGENGLLVSPGEDRAVSLAEAMRQLLSNGILRKDLGCSAKLFIAENFSTETICDTWERQIKCVATYDAKKMY